MDEKKNDLIEIAKKKRYIALVENLNRRSLSAKEVRELEELQKHFDKKKPADDVFDGTVDLPTMCVYLEKSPRMIRRYVTQGMPVIRDTTGGEIFRFRVSDVFKWYYRLRNVSEKDNKEYWANELKKNQAKLSELLLKQKEKSLIPFVDHVSIVKNQVRGIKSGFLRLPKYVAPKLYQQDPKVICETLDQEIRFIIEQFAGTPNANKNRKENT